MDYGVVFFGSGGCWSYTILIKAGRGLSYAYGGLPVMSSITVHPNDQISLFVLIKSCPFAVSGAIQ